MTTASWQKEWHSSPRMTEVSRPVRWAPGQKCRPAPPRHRIAQFRGLIGGIWVPGPSPGHPRSASLLAMRYALRTLLSIAEMMRLAVSFAWLIFLVISLMALVASAGLVTASLRKSNMSFSKLDLSRSEEH